MQEILFSSTGPNELSVMRAKVAAYPRIRYMGSKYKIVPALLEIFSKLDFQTPLDAFSGSGVVGYAMKVMGKRVVTNDFLNFASTLATAAIENPQDRLSVEEVATLVGPPADDRDFIRRTFRGLYFPDSDHAFLDSAWSHIDRMPHYKRDIAIAALCLAAARKQPRGVFTVTTPRYDDGRRFMHMPLREQFPLAVAAYNEVVFDSGEKCMAQCGDVFDVDPSGFDLVYLDPPYAPPRDDNDYIKRYHFLEGLSVYWRGQTIMEHTITKKIEKRWTPFAYKHSIEGALGGLFDRFRDSTIVLSYGSNSVPDAATIRKLLAKTKKSIKVVELNHRYHFGTHDRATRREAVEYIFVGR